MHRAERISQPHLTILNSALQAHAAVGQRRQRLARLQRQIDDAQILRPLMLTLISSPPHIRRTPTVTHQHHLRSATARFPRPLFIRQTDINPQVDGTG